MSGAYENRYLKGKKKKKGLAKKILNPKKALIDIAKNKIQKEDVKEEKSRKFKKATKGMSKGEVKSIKKGNKNRKNNINFEKAIKMETSSRILDAQKKIAKAKKTIQKQKKRKRIYKSEMNPTGNWKSKSATPETDRYGEDKSWESDKPIKLRTHDYNLRRGYYKKGSAIEGDEPLRFGYRSNIHKEDYNDEWAEKGDKKTRKYNRGESPAMHNKMYKKLKYKKKKY